MMAHPAELTGIAKVGIRRRPGGAPRELLQGIDDVHQAGNLDDAEQHHENNAAHQRELDGSRVADLAIAEHVDRRNREAGIRLLELASRDCTRQRGGAELSAVPSTSGNIPLRRGREKPGSMMCGFLRHAMVKKHPAEQQGRREQRQLDSGETLLPAALSRSMRDHWCSSTVPANPDGDTSPANSPTRAGCIRS